MTILQQGRQRFAMLAKEADRQTSDQPDRLAAVGEWRQCGERQRLGVFGEKLSLIKRESASTRLSFSQLADEIRFAANDEMTRLRAGARQQAFAELDLGGFTNPRIDDLDLATGRRQIGRGSWRARGG